MPSGSRVRAPLRIRGLSAETVADLTALFRRIASEQRRLSDSGAVLPPQTRALSAAPGRTYRIAPPPAGLSVTLPAPEPANMGPEGAITFFTENPEGPVTFAVVPPRTGARATINGQALLRLTEEGLVRFYSNGVDRWSTVRELPTGVSEDGQEIVAVGIQGPPGEQGPPGPVEDVSAFLDTAQADSLGWLFDGTSGALVLHGNNLDKVRTDAFSLSVWYRSRAPGTTAILAGKLGAAPAQQGWALFLTNVGFGWRLNNNVSGGANSLAVNNTNVPPDLEWHHVVVTYDGSSAPSGVTFYFDGSLLSSNSTQNNTLTGSTSNSVEFGIGARSADGGFPFTGEIKHVSVWDKELSLSEVGELRAGDEPAADLLSVSMAANLEFWCKLDENDDNGTDGFIDHSGNNYHGTQQGGVALDSVVGNVLQRTADGWQSRSVEDVVGPALTRLPAIPKAWVRVTGNGGLISEGMNIASTADGGNGVLSVQFAEPMATTAYAVIGTVEVNSTTLVYSCTVTSISASGFTGQSVVEAGSGTDPSSWSFIVFGTLA